MIVQTPRLIIRDYNNDDLEALFRILSDPITMSFWPKPFSREDTRSWLLRSIDLYQEYGFGRRAVILEQTDELIGDCGIMSATVDEMEVEDIGWIIASSHWRQGYGTEAAMVMRDYAFKRLTVDTLYANMPWNHYASIRVAEKIGMVKVDEFENIRNRGVQTLLYAMRQP